MATFTKRGTRWRAQVRRVGQSPLSKTFANRADAAAWARDVEHKIDRGQTIDPGRKFKLSELAAAYRQHFSSKGMGRSKSQSLAKIEKLLGHRRLIELKTPTFIDFCKTREQEGAGPATILQDLSYVGTMLRHGAALIGAEHAAATCCHGTHSTRCSASHSSSFRAHRESGRTGPSAYGRGNSTADSILVA